jgi:prepilin-type N-terminal cleavage/methylation domain-containing protein
LSAGRGGVTVLAAMKTLSAKAKISGFTLIELLVMLAVLAVTSARADTNIIAVLTTVDGISYTNAHIGHVTPIYADVWYDSGIIHTALTNLPEPLRSQYLMTQTKLLRSSQKKNKNPIK